LTGLITDTGSFQNSNTTPKSLTVSAQLVAGGGRQQEIVQHVYKTRPLSTLKLWGRALTKLQYDPAARVVWSSLTREDFAETGGTPTEAKAVIDALMSSAPDAEVILLLRESDEGKVDGSLRTVKGVDATKIAGIWNGGGHTGAAGFDVSGSLSEVEKDVVSKVQDWQRKRLGAADQPVPKQAAKQAAQAPASQPPQPVAKPTEPRSPTQTQTPGPQPPPAMAKPSPQAKPQPPVADNQPSPPVPDPRPAPQPAAAAPAQSNQPPPVQPARPAAPPQSQPPAQAAAPKPLVTEHKQPTPPTVEEALKVAQAAGTAQPNPPPSGARLRDRDMAHRQPEPSHKPVTEPPAQAPLSDEQLDAYFRKTAGGQQDVIDQPPAQAPPPADNLNT